MTLTNFLLLLILTVLTTYVFTPWKGMQKGSTSSIAFQFIIWLVVFIVMVFLLKFFNLVN